MGIGGEVEQSKGYNIPDINIACAKALWQVEVGGRQV